MPGAIFHPVSYDNRAIVPDVDTDRERVDGLCQHLGFKSSTEFLADPRVQRIRSIIFDLLMLKKDGYPGSRLADLVLGVPNGFVAVVLEHALLEGEVRRVRYRHKPNDFEYRLSIEKWVDMEADG